MSAEVRPGYKRTEIGVVPEDWSIKSLADLCSFENGDRGKNYPSPGSFVSSGIPFINAGHLSNGNIDLHQMDYITPERFNKLGGGKVRDGDILFCLRGSLGKFGLITSAITCGAIASSLVIVRPKTSSTTKEYLSSYFSSELCANMIETWAGGAAQPNLGAQDLAKFLIAIPQCKGEQEKISSALADMSALISSLDQLIAKRRDIQQATMQQLLTGQRRLPGFSGKWLAVKARDIGLFRGGNGFPNRFQGEASGAFPFYKVSDMNNEGNEIFMSTANNYIAEDVRKAIGAVIFPANSIVFAKVGAAVFLERKKILTTPSCLDNNMAAFIVDERRVCVRFMHYSLLNIRLGDLVSTTALPSLSNPVLSSIEIILPPISEQQAIATILSDIDAELATLETRRDKALQLKLGMMQELLTGRIRLT